MRTIKFRGKRALGSTHEWIYGYYQQYNGEYYIIDDSSYSYEILPDTVGQFTGAADDTDDELPIYEGDVLELIKINDDATEQKIIAVVKWLNIFGGFVVEDIKKKGNISLLGDVISVLIVYKIGNIHDNPELLRGGTA